MQKSLDVEIREQLHRYLTSELSLDAFNEWLTQHTWNVHQTNNPQAEELRAAIELLLAEFSHGDWTLEELHHQLSALLQQQSVSGFSYPPSFTYTPTSESMQSMRTVTSSRLSIPTVIISSPGVVENKICQDDLVPHTS